MRLKELVLRQFRNYESCHLDLPAGMTWVIGPNGSGKTNLLEAAYLVCTATSHRTTRDSELVLWSRDSYFVKGIIAGPATTHEITVSYKPDSGKQVAVDSTILSRRSELLQWAGAVIFSPDDLVLVKGPPEQRRKFIDRLAVFMDRGHAADLAELRSIIRQRNSLLYDIKARRTSSALAGLFDQQYSETGSRVRARRFRVLQSLQPLLEEHLQGLGGHEKVSLFYSENSENDHAVTFDQAAGYDFWLERAQADLARLEQDEQQRGITLWGPQRDDVVFQINGREARKYASQGQQRSLVLALKYAELSLLEQALASPPLLLLDDVLSELDHSRSMSLLRAAAEHEQTILTATDAAAASAAAFIKPAAQFQVVAGRIKGVEG